MSTTVGPVFPHENLVFMVDAGNTKSYSTSDTTKWYDISGKTGHYMDLGSGVSYQSSFGGVLRFTENSSGYARISDSYVDLRSGQSTVVTFSRKLSNQNNGRIVTAWQNNWLLGHHDTSYGDYYAQGWVHNISAGGGWPSDTTWRMFTGTGNTSSDVWQLYINDSLTVQNSSGSQGPRGLNINNQYSKYSNAEVSMIACWDRVLTASEISDIFYIYRKRFGI